MPYVILRTIKEMLTPELKAKFIAKISEAVVDVIVDETGADRENVLPHVWCIIEEVSFENWGVNGVPSTPESLKKLIGISEATWRKLEKD